MATRSSILAWRLPWTEEPGGPQSMGSQLDTTERLTLLPLKIQKEFVFGRAGSSLLWAGFLCLR